MVSPRQLAGRLPLRLRLTLWTVLLVALAVGLFGGLLSWQLERRLLAATDAALEVVTVHMLTVLDVEDGRPAFEQGEFPTALPTELKKEQFAVRLLAPEGTQVWAGLGATAQMPPLRPPVAGYATREGVEEAWRLRVQPVRSGERLLGWLEVGQSLEALEETLEALRDLLLWSLPFLLLLAGGGGFFLAERALRPIDEVTRTARRIGADDLSRRIRYDGPADEVGRLARTFDEMLDRLEAAWQQERRFTTDAAHELRTPLAVLKGQIEVTRSRPRAPEAYEETLDRLGEQVERLIRLSNDLLFLARFDATGRVQAWEQVEVSRLLSSLAEQVEGLMHTRALHFGHTIAPGLVVAGGSDLLIRLFLNLLQNAARYTPEGGQVWLAAEQVDERVVVRVSDSGPGIPPDALPHLFERFYRVQADRSRGSGGAGLGLAIAQEIARAHGGQITVESVEGEGSTFAVSLPATPPRPE